MAAPMPENPRLDFLRSKLKEIFGTDVLAPLPSPLPPEDKGKICVVGAGFAGLATAHFLVHLGYSVVVFEASDRVGGRVWTDRKWLAGAHIERGAELIGDNHVVWVGLARAFGLGLTRLDTGPDDSARRPLRLDGTVYRKEEAKRIWEAVDAACGLLDPEAAKVTSPYRPWDESTAAQLDAKSLGTRLDEMKGEIRTNDWRAVRLALEGLFSNDNVVPTHDQSLLAVLALVRGGGPEGGFWADSETQRCEGGNDALATSLEKALTESSRAQIRMKTPVTGIFATDDGARVVANDKEETFAYVVLTAPPSVWKDIKTTEKCPFPKGLQQGPAIKVFSRLENRFWNKDEDPDGMAVSSKGSTAGGETWDGTAGQPTPVPELSVFAGGPAADAALKKREDGGDGGLYEWYTEALEALFPGYADDVKCRTYEAWPLVKWIETGYSSPAPGQVTTIARDLAAPRGRMIIAGEQTCPAFVGFMEGALESGLMAAARVRGMERRDQTYDRLVQVLDDASTKPARPPSGPAPGQS